MPTIRQILCPTDFSPTARRAVEHAVDLARTFGAQVVLLNVLPEFTYPLRSFGMVASFPNLREELHKRAAEELEAVRKTVDPAIKVRTELRDGPAHVQILATADEIKADLIVIGTHGHTGLKHVVLGSTAERVVRLAKCPVMTVRSPE
jgi:nucleotide-binding universal stress UspA family protein